MGERPEGILRVPWMRGYMRPPTWAPVEAVTVVGTERGCHHQAQVPRGQGGRG